MKYEARCASPVTRHRREPTTSSPYIPVKQSSRINDAWKRHRNRFGIALFRFGDKTRSAGQTTIARTVISLSSPSPPPLSPSSRAVPMPWMRDANLLPKFQILEFSCHRFNCVLYDDVCHGDGFSPLWKFEIFRFSVQFPRFFFRDRSSLIFGKVFVERWWWWWWWSVIYIYIYRLEEISIFILNL